MARPSLLTPELRAEVETALAAGTPVRIAAQGVGVSQATLHSWLAQGLVVRRPRLRLVEEEAEQEIGPDPAEDDAKIEAALVGAVMKAAAVDWRAARWLLRNRWPDRWTRA